MAYESRKLEVLYKSAIIPRQSSAQLLQPFVSIPCSRRSGLLILHYHFLANGCVPILSSSTYGNKRFGEILNDIEDITPKMLSRELKSLGMNKIIERTLFDFMPVKTEHSLTPLGTSMNNFLKEISNWGIHFREENK